MVLGFDEPFAHPVPSFQTPVVPPDSDPDTGDMQTVCIPLAWLPFVLGACSQLTLQSTWKTESPDDTFLAQSRATNLIDMIANPACATAPAPFWDDDSGDDADDELPEDVQPWYGDLVIIDDRLDFRENLGIWLITGFIAYAGLPTAAISFLPIARNFVVTVKSNPLGGIVRFLADSVEIGRVDTYSAADGVISTPLTMPAPTMAFRAEDVTYPTLWVELLDDNPHGLESVSITLIRSRLSANDFSDPSYRYNADCDCIQYTPDGGTTWIDAPGNDPRHAPQFRLPPVAGSSKQCDAAANKVKWLKDFIDSVIHALGVGAIAATIINTALEFVDLLFPGATLLELLIEFADVALGAGDALLNSAFDSETYSLLNCIFYCDSADDGSVDATQLAQVESDISAQLNTTAALVTNLVLQIQGEVGLSNAGAIGSETGDCSDCGCTWEHHFDFSVDDGGWRIVDWNPGQPQGTYVAACCWQSTADGVGHDIVSIGIDFPASGETQLTGFDYVIEIGGGGGGEQFQYDSNFYFSVPVTGIAPMADGTYLLKAGVYDFSPALTRIYSATLRGTGVDPYL